MVSPVFDDRKRRTEQWLQTVNNLPPFPPMVEKAIALLDDQRSSAGDVAKVIGQDEAITAKILRVVNSAFYGVPGRVTTVSHAVALLGFEQLRLLLMGVALLERGRSRDPAVELARKRLWAHSSTCARWAQELAKTTRYHPAEEAAVAGLLHDVGKVVLIMAGPGEFLNCLALIHAEGVTSFDAEEDTLGFNHLETGRMVCERWRLPSAVRHAVALHHYPWGLGVADDEPDASRLRHLLAIVRVANQASKESLAQRPPEEEGVEPTVPINPQQLLEKVLVVNGLLAG